MRISTPPPERIKEWERRCGANNKKPKPKPINMKLRNKIIIAITTFLVGLLITYGGCVFISLQPNPLLWSQDTRVFITLFGWFIPVVLSLVSFIIMEKQNTNDRH